MKVLSIGTDRTLYDEKSAVSERTIMYGQKMEELHIVVFSLKKHGLAEKKLSANVTIYPTNSFSRLNYIWDALAIGKKIIQKKSFCRGA